jgi:hypothetical protein
VRFASFFSGGFITAIVVNPPEMKLAKCTSGQCYIYSIVLGAAIKCKQYSGITMESGTPLKSVKITLNICI